MSHSLQNRTTETGFENEPLLDFTLPESVRAVQAALEDLDLQIHESLLNACPIIAGKEEPGRTDATSVDPSDPSTAVGTVSYCSPERGVTVLRGLQQHALSWARRPIKERADILHRVASLLRERRHFFTALIIREAGKPWIEADADVVEAIDFCDYYAVEMMRRSAPQRTMELMGEDNFYLYQPRGTAVVISPWNFPLAIACGMTVASLVTGNATVLKPAEQTSIIAYYFSRLLLEAGVPGEIFAFLPGVGETLGAALVRSPLVDLICFTGSKSVGLNIIEAASHVHPEQRNVKRVIAEMGGKNAIVVDEDADLDEAAKGVLSSAFGFAGQKCSACSRLIVVSDAYEPLLARLQAAAADLIVGASSLPETFLGPVIDEESQQRILQVIDAAKRDLGILAQGSAPGKGYFVPITIFRDVPETHPLWTEEVFGPVLACAQAPSFDEAIAMAGRSQYALTGGVYSRSPIHLQQAKETFRVGNLYLNRGITGAAVKRQPFGGSAMSGVGSKAGGPDYLLQFLDPRTITENTMRRGFTPDLL